MEEERSSFQIIKDGFPILFAFGLVFAGAYIYLSNIGGNFVVSFLLFVISSLSMMVIFTIWRSFTEKYAPGIIFWTTQHKYARKLIAGGSFSYYEYKDNVHKIGLFEPISRFISMMIAFIGIATTFANSFGIKPDSPFIDFNAAIIWGILIFVVPIILTPIVPIIWAMEDLQLKSWNAKAKTNLKVSGKYKARFNSFIAVGTLGVAFSLSQVAGQTVLESATNFATLLLIGLEVLTYPIAILTFLYYIYFRGNVIAKIRARMTIPMAETKLIYRNIAGQILDAEGKVLAEKPDGEKDLVAALVTGKASPSEEMLDPESKKNELIPTKTGSEEQKNLPQKIGSGAKNAVTATGDAVVGTGKAIVGGITGVGKSISDNTVGRIFGKKKETEKENSVNSVQDDQKSNYKYKGGSATAGLWDHDDETEDKNTKNKKK